jgi:Putative prokaryotic signal transducing protein
VVIISVKFERKYTMENIIIVKNYDNLWQAELARNLLKANNINCVLQTAGVSKYPLAGNMDVIVSLNDAIKAKQILEEYNS